MAKARTRVGLDVHAAGDEHHCPSGAARQRGADHRWLRVAVRASGSRLPQWEPEVSAAALRGTISSDCAVVLTACIDGELVGFCTAYDDIQSVRFGRGLRVRRARKSARESVELVAGEMRLTTTSTPDSSGRRSKTRGEAIGSTHPPVNASPPGRSSHVRAPKPGYGSDATESR